MKTSIFIAAITLFFASCSLEKPNTEKAKQVVENCLKAIDKGDVKTVREEYYTSEFVRAETEEQLAEKFKKLKEVTGAMKSFEMVQNAVQEETGEEASVLLTYLVKHDRVTTREEFVVVVESGKHKISSHLISNE
ncbi:MAG TPA: hypothetical protein VNZ49_04100 [Bacteroidia bacterium]|jgi:hypothetical protein|nr:hypothetical protein [Bacteroidia bacterium]